MNKERRALIEEIKSGIDLIYLDIESVKEEEQTYYDNMPEGIKNSEKGEKAESAIGALESALDSLDEVIENLDVAAE